jgi:hypothetical protein
MDQLNTLLTTPGWAYQFCYYYAFVAAIVVVSSLYSLVQLFMVPAVVRKFLPLTFMSLSLVLSALVAVVLTLMQFWICRGALKPTAEKFAVKCKNTNDCTAVMGVPQDSECECGGRGLCGGCRMRNNMEPSMLPEYSESFASIAEGFRGRR